MLEALREREDQISTGIGSGVAIPHAFYDGTEGVITAFCDVTRNLQVLLMNEMIKILILSKTQKDLLLWLPIDKAKRDIQRVAISWNLCPRDQA